MVHDLIAIAESSLSAMRRQVVRVDCRTAGGHADSHDGMEGEQQHHQSDSSTATTTTTSISSSSSSVSTNTASLQQPHQEIITNTASPSTSPDSKLASLIAAAASASLSFPPGSGVCGTGDMGERQPPPIDFVKMQEVLGLAVPQPWDSLNLSRVI